MTKDISIMPLQSVKCKTEIYVLLTFRHNTQVLLAVCFKNEKPHDAENNAETVCNVSKSKSGYAHM